MVRKSKFEAFLEDSIWLESAARGKAGEVEVYRVGSVGEQATAHDKLVEHARKTALARLTPAESQCEFAELLYRSSRPSLALNGRTFPSAVPKWVLQAVSHRFEYIITLLQGVIGATEVARCAASPRTIALLKERLVLGASGLHQLKRGVAILRGARTT